MERGRRNKENLRYDRLYDEDARFFWKGLMEMGELEKPG